MHTTTVRFDPETWELLKRRCEELGIATADFIRVATVQRLERLRLEHRLIAVELRLKKVERALGWLVRRLTPQAAGPVKGMRPKADDELKARS